MRKYSFILILIMTVSFCAVPNVVFANKSILRNQLMDVLGDQSSWVPKYLSNLKAGMSCDDVRKLYTTLTECDAKKEFNYPTAKIENQPIIDEIKFVFDNDKLKDAEIVFKYKIDDTFKEVSLEVFEAKWGAIKLEDRDEDFLTKVSPSFDKAIRNLRRDQWSISFNFPEFPSP